MKEKENSAATAQSIENPHCPEIRKLNPEQQDRQEVKALVAHA